MAEVFTRRLAATENIGGAIARLIRSAVLDGRLVPGERIKEGEIASQLGVSRTPVREALLILKAQGLVDLPPNRGATVCSYEPKDLSEIYEVRAALEGFVARKAAQDISATQLEVLEQSCERFAGHCETAAVEQLIQENLFFHNTIMETSSNSRLVHILRGTIELPLVYKSYLWNSIEHSRSSERYHREITKALKAADGARAQELMEAHALEARDFLLQVIGTDSRSESLDHAGSDDLAAATNAP